MFLVAGWQSSVTVKDVALSVNLAKPLKPDFFFYVKKKLYKPNQHIVVVVIV